MEGYDFYLVIEDVFSITGRGTVVTGRIQKGQIHIGESVTLLRTNAQIEVTGIEQFRKVMDSASEGDNVGLLLRGVGRDEVVSGDVLTKGAGTSDYREFYNPVMEENTPTQNYDTPPKPIKTGCLWSFLVK